jgi:hypothetical protein
MSFAFSYCLIRVTESVCIIELLTMRVVINQSRVYGIDVPSLKSRRVALWQASAIVVSSISCSFVVPPFVHHAAAGPPPPFHGYYSSSAVRGGRNPAEFVTDERNAPTGSQGNKTNCQVVVQLRSDHKQLMQSLLLGHQINTKCEINWAILKVLGARMECQVQNSI